MMAIDPFSAALFGLSIAEGIGGAASQREQARNSIESIDRQMNLLSKQKDELGQYYTEKKGYVTDAYGNQVTSLIDKVGQQLYATEDKYTSAMSKSNLSYSGTLSNKASMDASNLNKQYSNSTKTLTTGLKSDLSTLEYNKQKEFGQIDLQLESLKGERKMYESQSKERFLGIF